MNTWFASIYQALIWTGNFLQPFFLLGVRLFWGWQFFSTGLAKLGDLNTIADYFATLGIPVPGVNAVLAGTAETVGGLFLLIGFASRLAALPLIATMVVALLTAHREAVTMIWQDATHFIAQTPFTFLMASLLIFIFGPGAFSVDALIKKWVQRSR